MSGNVGSSLAYRVDVVRREGRDFYNTVIDGDDRAGPTNSATRTTSESSTTRTASKRNYTGLHTSLSYRKGGFNGGINWTWSHTLGNLNGETAASGPVPNATEAYPEYKDPRLEQPVRVARDGRAPPRQALRVVHSFPFIPAKVGSLNVSAIQSVDTGVPYGAVGSVDSRPYVTARPTYVDAADLRELLLHGARRVPDRHDLPDGPRR